MEAFYRLEPLSDNHDRGSFSCGTPAIDDYFKTRAGQESKKYLAKCFVAVSTTDNSIVGFYTLSAGSVPLDLLPQTVAKNIRYHDVPVILLGRIGVDRRFQGQGIGTELLLDACEHAMNAPIGAIGVVLDAKETVKNWYLERDFEIIQELRLILTFKNLLKILQKAT